MTKRRSLGSKHNELKLNQHGGIFGTLSEYATITWNAITSAWVSTPLAILNIRRMSFSIIKDANHAYNYYRYATTIDIDRVPVPQFTKDRFLEAKNNLNEMLVYIKKSNMGIRLCGIAYANYTKDQTAYNQEVAALDKIEESTSSTLHPTRIKQLFDSSMVTFYGDWYRYELNILLTRLVAVVNEIIVSFVGLPRIGNAIVEPNTRPFISVGYSHYHNPMSSMRVPQSKKTSLKRDKLKNS